MPPLRVLPRRLGAPRSHNAPRSTGRGWFRRRGTGAQLAAEIGAPTDRHLNSSYRRFLRLRLHRQRAEVAQQATIDPTVADGRAVFESGPIAVSSDVWVSHGYVKRAAGGAAEE